MTRMQRALVNLFGSRFRLRGCFPPPLLDEMAVAIAAGESRHQGEIRFAVEARLALTAVLAGQDASARAREVFSQLRVWDTERNNGVLFYVLLAERRIEIVADRGIAANVTNAEWADICHSMRDAYAGSQWREGSLAGIAAANRLLATHFPADASGGRNELSDRPVLL